VVRTGGAAAASTATLRPTLEPVEEAAQTAEKSALGVGAGERRQAAEDQTSG